MDLDFNNGASEQKPDTPVPGQAPLPVVPQPVSATESTAIAPTPQAPSLSDVSSPTSSPTPIPVASSSVPSVDAPTPVPVPVNDVIASNPPADFQPIPEHVDKGSGMLKILLLILGLAIVGAGAFLFLTDSGKALLGLSTSEPEVTETAELTDDTIGKSSVTSNTTNSTQQPTSGSVTSSDTSSSPIATRDAQRKDDLAKIKEALDKYYAAKGSFPTASQIVKTSDASSAIVSALVPTYIATLPNDPSAPEYWYGYKSLNDSSYELTARLEDTTDLAGKIENSLFIYRINGTPSPVSQDNATTSGASTDFESGQGS